ncbi:MAG: phage holin family protein [Nitriliruptor sp.]|nr:MAG: phage holin family protein [Nitriliruptor sp.]
MVPTTPPTGGPDGAGATDERDTSEVIASLLANGQGLLKTELELGKLEVQRIATEKAIAVGLAVGGALIGLFILAFVGVTGAHALMLVVQPWLAWLIVTGIYILLAVILLLVAVRYFKRPVKPEQTLSEVEKTKAWASEQVSR